MSDTTGRKLFQHSGTALLLRGALAILFGLVVASLPVATVFGLVYVFGVYAIADGLTDVAHYFYDPSRHSRWSMIGGIISVAAGLVAVAWPGITAAALAFLIGTWALLLGISQIILAMDARTTIRAWWIWLMTGFVTTLFGLFVLVNPGTGFLSVVALLATFTVVVGLLLIASGLKLRRLGASSVMPAR
ncbi:HdeD family acid-resistance protein [Arthrobacter sp. 24S4-2]|uniref:HdeD family acid-resistance protein n=1 Tax=Arthrobacter sp. 24S4-2 TaxID=2575374 RepID=UPI0010C78756|nr:HdeD family acid-resistance protein [Arthrobacter sp. 24S4-2]QCO97068.1 HdeD family acid-resistance protein [Arthrobacter sp. 24S4-2]